MRNKAFLFSFRRNVCNQLYVIIINIINSKCTGYFMNGTFYAQISSLQLTTTMRLKVFRPIRRRKIPFQQILQLPYRNIGD